MNLEGYRVEAAGESGLLLRFGDEVSEALNQRVFALLAALDATRPPWVSDLVPGFASLLVLFDPLATSSDRVTAWIERGASQAARATLEGAARWPSRQVEVPVCYGKDLGPDLDDVAARIGLTPARVIELHSSREYLVFMLGFKPGFPYLGVLDERLRLPRLDAPRPVVPAGSVAIAGAQTGIYPAASPGGWRLLGRTPWRLFDPAADEPCRVRPHDRVRFVPVTRERFDELAEEEGTA